MILAEIAVVLSVYTGCVQVISFEPQDNYKIPAVPDTSEVRGEPEKCGLIWWAEIVNDCRQPLDVRMVLLYLDKDKSIVLLDDTNEYTVGPNESLEIIGVTEAGCANEEKEQRIKSVEVYARPRGTQT